MDRYSAGVSVAPSLICLPVARLAMGGDAQGERGGRSGEQRKLTSECPATAGRPSVADEAANAQQVVEKPESMVYHSF
jgi:hypothetical protein